jgi:hypothetical protein
MEKYGFVYVWRDKKHNRYYIGSHWGTVDDGYICSSRTMRNAYRRRPEDFKRKIIQYIKTDRKALYEAENSWLKLAEKRKEKYYNLVFVTNHWSAYPENVSTIKEKISSRTKEAMWKDDVRSKFLDGIQTRDTKSSDKEVRRKRSISMKETIKGRKWPLNDVPDNTGSIRLWKENAYKMVKEDTERWKELREFGWKTKREILLDLVEEFRYEVNDYSSDLQSISKRMVGIGYITEKEYYRYLK